MPRYVALLRGINVGGHNKVAMADLRAVASSLDLADVSTYIQSGNLLFSSDGTDAVPLADALEQAISARLGVQPAVVVLSAAELARVIAANPFPGETNPRLVHAVLRRDEVDAAGVAAVAAAVRQARAAGSRDDAAVVGPTLFLHTPDGMGRSELMARLGRAGVQATGTARNWATVTKLMTMLETG